MGRKLAILSLVGLALALPARAETTRTLRIELTGDPARPFAVENLAGAMRVTPGTGTTVLAVATVHAESDALAGDLRFEQVAGDKGVPTLRVRYPVDRHTTFRYGASKDGGFLGGLFGGNSNIEYDGHRVTVSGSRGVLLYADVEVQVPRKAVDASFRNHVGPISAEGLLGRVRLDSGSGDVTARAMKGDVTADTGSGDVKATEIEGSLTCDTGSGDCVVSGFQGETLKCDTGSGRVEVETASARRISVDTGSGSVKVRGADAEEFDADTGSGDVELVTAGSRLARVRADTGSGDVRLRLAPDAGFEARADTGSGDIVSRFSDAQPIVHGKQVVGYRRGDGKIRIEVETGSGDVVIEPGR